MKVKTLSAIVLSVAILGGLALPAFAQVEQLSFKGILKILDRLTRWLFIVLLSLAVIMIIISAYKYLTAAGDESKITSAHKTLIYALIAIGIGLLSRGVVFLISELVGISSAPSPSIQTQIPIPLPPIPLPPPPPPPPFFFN